VLNASWVSAYQDLLEQEEKKVNEAGFKDVRSFLSIKEINSVCEKYGIDLEQFLSSDLLVEYPEFGWRTIHFDLIYRIVHIRNLERQAAIPFEYRIEKRSEPVPDFGRHKFEEVLELIPNESVRRIVLSALCKSKYEGFSSHQLPIVRELLSKEPRYTTVAIVAPTASGKTLAFFLPVIVKALERSLEGKVGVSSILVYPRKALERDQLQSFLSLIDSVNQHLAHQITVGVDDGDTKRFDDIQSGDKYREMKCILCSNTLIIDKKEGASTVKCSKCSRQYPYLLASKDEIWQKKPMILITNIHTLYRRLLSTNTLKMLTGVDYLVFDEAHVYTDYLGGHVHYIIKLLRHVASLGGFKPFLIFSSATIPNPLDFIAKLAGVRTDDIFYVDYYRTLEKVQDTQRRLMLYLYLLPRPSLSAETLTESLILAITLWCHKHKLKAITFVDSVAEISTLADYIHTTILDKRQGREVTDHLYNATNRPENDYSWLSLAPQQVAVGLDTFKGFVLNEYKASIGVHYGQLPLSQRARVEYDFSQGLLKLLLSTSTLELGIDLSDVAVIIQHKLPLTPEGVVQRVGRSGRSPVCLRVALGVIVLDSSPLSTLYMFDEGLRGRLADPSLLPPARVGQASTSIKLQHVLSLLLYKRALESKPTFIPAEEYLKSKHEVVNAVREIVSELNEELITFNAKVRLFDDETALRKQIHELKSLLSLSANAIKDAEQAIFGQVKERWESILADIERKADDIRQLLRDIDTLKRRLEKILEFDEKVLSGVDSLRKLLTQAYSLCSTLLSSARASYRIGDEGPIQRWYKANSNAIEIIAKQTPDSDEILSLIYTPLTTYFTIKMKSDFRAFRAKYGFGFDEIINILTNITTCLGSRYEDGLAYFLKELPNITKFLHSVNLKSLIACEAFKQIESELKTRPWGIDIIEAINRISLNRIRFSLILEPPSPELQVVGVETT
jgi:superfamily II DNA/RNA helicase